MNEDFQKLTLNGVTLVARSFLLEALYKAHLELSKLGIGVNGKVGFVPAPQKTASWRSLALQKELLASGATRTLYSNHRRGTAVDCYADWSYINAIRPIMEKYGLTNDLAYIDTDSKGKIVRHDSNPFDGSYVDASEFKAWDGGHWNWKSNEVAETFSIKDSLDFIQEFSMPNQELEIVQLIDPGKPGSGGFALLKDGKKQVIASNRLAEALATILCEKHLTRKQWDDIESDRPF